MREVFDALLQRKQGVGRAEVLFLKRGGRFLFNLTGVVPLQRLDM